MNVCSRCLRTAYNQVCLEQGARIQASTFTKRSITTSALRRQQNHAPTQSRQQPQQPLPMPTTAPTITTNVTADAGAQAAQVHNPQDGPSTAQMQKQIASSLSPKPLSMRLAMKLRSSAKGVTETYITYGLTEGLIKSCTAQAPYTVPEDQRMGVYTGQGPPKNARGEDVGVPDASVKLGKGADSWWFRELGLEPTFSTWSQVSFLHMYILTVKLRTLPDQKTYLEHQRYLTEHFSALAEDKMNLLHGMSARGVRNRYLKDLFQQWRGVLYAYDEGLVKGDAVLAGAVWRNLWKADEDVDWTKVAVVVAYMRRTIAALADASIQKIASELNSSSGFWELAQEGLVEEVTAASAGISEPLANQPA